MPGAHDTAFIIYAIEVTKDTHILNYILYVNYIEIVCVLVITRKKSQYTLCTVTSYSMVEYSL